MSSSDQVRTYSRAESVVFLKTDKPFGGLSNMAGGYPIRVNGIRILTSEALYQVCRFPHLPDVQRMIIGENSPMTAKMKSKPHRKNSRSDWDRVRVKVMRWCLRVKLAQNWAKFSELLLRTGDRPIVEESRRDDFWGAKTVDEQTLVGMNVLGRLLMELREAVKSQGRDSLLSVAPLDIPEFLLFGRPIGTVAEPGQITPDAAAPPTAMAREVGRKEELAEQGSLFDAPAVREAPARTYAALPVCEEARLANLKPYPAMKESGVAWLGEVPGHWEVLPALAVCRPRQVRNTGLLESTVLSLSYGRIIVKQPEKLRGLVPESFETYQIVEPGNIIVRTTDLQNDQTSVRVGYARHRGIITAAYLCLETKPLVSDEFGYQYLNAYDLLKIIYGFGSGLRQNLDFSDIKRMPVLVPPPAEQAAIVRFLDHADRRIRRYIRAKQKLIKLLEEQKQAIIHQAVTGRIDVRTGQPYPAYKNSGVEWLGEVPEHWEVSKLRQCGSILGGLTPSMADRSLWDGDVPWVTPKDMKRFTIEGASMNVATRALEVTSLRLIPSGSVLLVVRGMILARRVPIARTVQPVTINQDMKAIVPAAGINAGYLAYRMDSAQAAFVPMIDEAGHGTKRFPTERWKDIMFAIPPANEQRQIVSYLDEVTAQLAAVADTAQREIALLHEYRTRLIADVVTGKLDVREAAARLPDESDELLPDAADDESIPDEPADDLDAMPAEAEA
jgi:type I restriction enzyme S subunit